MVMNKVIEKIKAKGENLCLLEGMERLEYLLEQSKNSRPMAQEHKTEQNKIRGCVSNLWLTGHKDTNNKMAYYHDAESHMTKGTAKVILDMVHGEDAKEVGELNLNSFKPLGIRELLTMQRQVGFASLIERIVKLAQTQ